MSNTEMKHVFIAYRQRIENIARKIAVYLRRNKIKVWFFPWRVGWGDSVTTEEENGIKNSFAGLIIFTTDFLEGRTATEEYRALVAKKRDDSRFKLGILRVNCGQEAVPPFLKDYFSVGIDSYEDPNFSREAVKILRGLYGLPLEPQELFDNLYDFALFEFGKMTIESKALEFVDYWFREMIQYDFQKFIDVYYYIKTEIYGPFLSNIEENRARALRARSIDQETLSKVFALEFTKKSNKFHLDTLKKITESNILLHVGYYEDISGFLFYIINNCNENEVDDLLENAINIQSMFSIWLDRSDLIKMTKIILDGCLTNTHITNNFKKLKELVEFAESELSYEDLTVFIMQWFEKFKDTSFSEFKRHYFLARIRNPAKWSIRYAYKKLHEKKETLDKWTSNL